MFLLFKSLQDTNLADVRKFLRLAVVGVHDTDNHEAEPSDIDNPEDPSKENRKDTCEDAYDRTDDCKNQTLVSMELRELALRSSEERNKAEKPDVRNDTHRLVRTNIRRIHLRREVRGVFNNCLDVKSTVCLRLSLLRSLLRSYTLLRTASRAESSAILKLSATLIAKCHSYFLLDQCIEITSRTFVLSQTYTRQV